MQPRTPTGSCTAMANWLEDIMLVGMVLNTGWLMHCHCKLITTKILKITNKWDKHVESLKKFIVLVVGLNNRRFDAHPKTLVVPAWKRAGGSVANSWNTSPYYNSNTQLHMIWAGNSADLNFKVSIEHMQWNTMTSTTEVKNAGRFLLFQNDSNSQPRQ